MEAIKEDHSNEDLALLPDEEGAPEIKVEPEPMDRETLERTLQTEFLKFLETTRDPGGYHLEMTSWIGKIGQNASRAKVSTHVENLGDLLAQIRWISDVLEHFGQPEEGKE